ncbi:MAG: hypothetical protein ACUVTA_01785 [Thermodesulfitimonas sp.]
MAAAVISAGVGRRPSAPQPMPKKEGKDAEALENGQFDYGW